MNFNFYQLVEVLVWGLLFLAAFKFRNKFTWVTCGIIAFVLFFFSPLKMTPQSISSIERPNSEFSDLPERVGEDRKTFSQKQQEEMEQLKQESEESTNEI